MSKVSKSIEEPSNKSNPLKIEQEVIENNIQNGLKQSVEDKSTDFMLLEFSELGESWRHTDLRIESSLKLYLTVNAIVVPTFAVLYQQLSFSRFFVLMSMFVALGIFVGGVFLLRRLSNTILLKQEYKLGLNMIRQYFVDNSPKIRRYLILPIGRTSTQLFFATRNTSLDMIIIMLWNSILLGFVISTLGWLVQPRLYMFSIIAIGLVAVITCQIIQNYFLGKQRITFEKWLGESGV